MSSLEEIKTNSIVGYRYVGNGILHVGHSSLWIMCVDSVEFSDINAIRMLAFDKLVNQCAVGTILDMREIIGFLPCRVAVRLDPFLDNVNSKLRLP